MLGIDGIEPGLMLPRLPRFPRFPRPPGLVIELIGDEVRSRNLLPDCASHSEICPIDAIVPTTRPSALKSASSGTSPLTSDRNSCPDFTSQIFTWLPRANDIPDVGACV